MSQPGVEDEPYSHGRFTGGADEGPELVVPEDAQLLAVLTDEMEGGR